MSSFITSNINAYLNMVGSYTFKPNESVYLVSDNIPHIFFFFFFNDTAPTEFYPFSLHDPLPIYLYHRRLARFLTRLTSHFDVAEEIINDTFLIVWRKARDFRGDSQPSTWILGIAYRRARNAFRSEEHTSELQSQSNLVCRLLLEK